MILYGKERLSDVIVKNYLLEVITLTIFLNHQ